jgi:adenylate cyclase
VANNPRSKNLRQWLGLLRFKWAIRVLRWFGVRRTLGFVLLAAFLALRISDPAPLENLKLRSFDFYQVLKPRNVTLKPVVVIDIDEESMNAIGQWPWPRTVLAELITRLRQYGVAAIGFDVLFPEPDRMSPASIARTFSQIDADTRKLLESLPSNDAVMADAMRGGKVVLGQSGVPFALPGTGAQDVPRTGFASMGTNPDPHLITFDGLLKNLPILERVAAGRGVLTIRPERDGIVRRVPLVLRAGGETVPALTLEMLRVVTQSGAILIRSDAAGIRNIAVPGLEIPTDQNGQLWINFSAHDPTRFVSAKDVLSGKVDPDRIAQRLAIVGTSAVGLLDIKATPVDEAMPGVEVQAQILENMLTKSVLSYPNYAVGVELLTALVFGTLVIVLAPLLSPLTLLALGLGIALALTAAAAYFYTQQGLLFDLTFPLLSTFVIYVTLIFINYFREQKDRRRIRSAFGQYLSPALVEQLAQSPKKLMLGGEVRDMTIMFSDVRGFTTISESFKDDPQGLTQLMNRFLTPMTNAIIERKGTIDKYIGDAIMAFWNAPLDDSDHERHACEAALDMLRRVGELNRAREQEALAGGTRYIPINIGIGVNTGQCVVGNMGSDLRFDYSVLGDPVNLASRLEGRSKSYGTPIIVGARTANRALADFAALEIDLITVKGKSEPEHIHALLGGPDEARQDDFRLMRDRVAEILRKYRSRDWTGALALLHQAQHVPNRFGLDGVYHLYSSRIRSFQETAPPDDWNGVHAFDTK